MAITLQDHTLEVAPFDGITRFRFKGSSVNLRSSQPEAPLRFGIKLRTMPGVNAERTGGVRAAFSAHRIGMAA